MNPSTESSKSPWQCILGIAVKLILITLNWVIFLCRSCVTSLAVKLGQNFEIEAVTRVGLPASLVSCIQHPDIPLRRAWVKSSPPHGAITPKAVTIDRYRLTAKFCLITSPPGPSSSSATQLNTDITHGHKKGMGYGLQNIVDRNHAVKWRDGEDDDGPPNWENWVVVSEPQRHGSNCCWVRRGLLSPIGRTCHRVGI